MEFSFYQWRTAWVTQKRHAWQRVTRAVSFWLFRWSYQRSMSLGQPYTLRLWPSTGVWSVNSRLRPYVKSVYLNQGARFFDRRLLWRHRQSNALWQTRPAVHEQCFCASAYPAGPRLPIKRSYFIAGRCTKTIEAVHTIRADTRVCAPLRITSLHSQCERGLFMVALCNRADHYIFALWFLSSSFFLFFPRLISAVGDWMSTILPHTVWP